MKKMIFLDLDGTIRDFDGFIPDSAKEAVMAARRNGHEVLISTGRPYFALKNLLPDMEFDGSITGSGSYVLYKEECLHHKFITQFTYLSLCNYLLDHHCAFELMTYKKTYLLRQCQKSYQKLSQKVTESIGENAPRFAEFSPTLIDSPLDIHEIEKFFFFSESLSLEEVKKHWGTCFYIVASSLPCQGLIAGELSPAVVNKAEGIRAVLNKCDLGPEAVIAIGDSDNDIEMLDLAGCGIAMGNGNDSVKAVADYITRPLKEDGLYHAFEYMGLI